MQHRALLGCFAVWQPSRPTLGTFCPAASQAHTSPAPLTTGNFNFGGGNPMRPHRVRLTHSLVDNYQLTKELLVHRPNMRTAGELQMFHADGESAGLPLPGCTGPGYTGGCPRWRSSGALPRGQLQLVQALLTAPVRHAHDGRAPKSGVAFKRRASHESLGVGVFPSWPMYS